MFDDKYKRFFLQKNDEKKSNEGFEKEHKITYIFIKMKNSNIGKTHLLTNHFHHLTNHFTHITNHFIFNFKFLTLFINYQNYTTS